MHLRQTIGALRQGQSTAIDKISSPQLRKLPQPIESLHTIDKPLHN
jgi:hypothetical protein